jgi:hypothetical protein
MCVIGSTSACGDESAVTADAAGDVSFDVSFETNTFTPTEVYDSSTMLDAVETPDAYEPADSIDMGDADDGADGTPTDSATSSETENTTDTSEVPDTEEPPDTSEVPDTNIPSDTSVPPDPGPARLKLIDAALSWSASRIYFFRGAEYIRYDFVADRADPGYPRNIADWWPGVFSSDIDAAVAVDGKVHFFRGDQYIRFDIAADCADPGYPIRIADAWPGVFDADLDAALLWKGRRVRFVRGGSFVDWSLDEGRVDPPGERTISTDWPGMFVDGLDAAVSVTSDKNYLFSERDYIRQDWNKDRPDDGYPRQTSCWWQGLWDPYSGTGRPGPNLPSAVATLLAESPSADEIAARKQRVAASITSGWVDRSPSYPLYLSSIEARLGAWGCLLLQQPATNVWRYRCASDTAGVRALDVAPWRVRYIDWRRAAYHSEQVSQGDFLAAAGTPISILRSDDGTFRITQILTDPPTGSISGGVRVRVRFRVGGVDKDIQFSHLNAALPAYVIDAQRDGTPLPTGTVFGFVGYTGNLWIAAPPAIDAPYSGNGSGLPDAHTHVWFVSQPENHETLAPFAREALTFCGVYGYGGG